MHCRLNAGYRSLTTALPAMPTSLPAKPAPVKSKNWLLAKSRQLHTWGGLFAALFLLVVGATGIVLNYEKPIFRALGIEKGFTSGRPAGKPGSEAKAAAPRFTTVNGFAAAAVSAERVTELARAELGDVPLDRIELKAEHGELVWKVKARGGRELFVNAVTGTHFAKGEYEKLGRPGTDGLPAKSFDWGKVLINLHTGKIGGEFGKALMTVAAAALLFLTLSGIYLYAKPVLIRRTNARARAASSTVPASAERPAVPGSAAVAS
jgi:hypothetical protein